MKLMLKLLHYQLLFQGVDLEPFWGTPEVLRRADEVALSGVDFFKSFSMCTHIYF